MATIRGFVLVSLCLCWPGLNGCSIGPKVIRCNMVPYNNSVVDSENEQFLLNLVRLRYRDTPKTLSLSQVTSQFTLDGIAPLSYVLPGGIPKGTTSIAGSTLTLGPLQSRLTDVPTITFIPQAGADFHRGLVVPIPLERVVLLANTGWDLELVMRLIVQNLNHVENARQTITLTSDRPIRASPDFNRVAAVLGKLHHYNRVRVTTDPVPILTGNLSDNWDVNPTNGKGGIDVKAKDLLDAADKHFTFQQEDGKKVVALKSTATSYLLDIDYEAFRYPEVYDALVNRLRLTVPDRTDPETIKSFQKWVQKQRFDRRLTDEQLWQIFDSTRVLDYRLLPGDKTLLKAHFVEGKDIFVGTRNIIGCAVFVSKGIEIPPQHYAEGLVEAAVTEDGQPYDWTEATEGLFKVFVSKSKPKHAFMAVRHRGYWFYIADNDLNTKTTFGLLKEMFDLQIAPGLSTAPILTLSAGGSTGR